MQFPMNNLRIISNNQERKVDESLVAFFELILKSAKAGKVVSTSIVYETNESIYYTTRGTDLNKAEHLLALEKLKSEIVNEDYYDYES
jgi:hypothetical protein